MCVLVAVVCVCVSGGSACRVSGGSVCVCVSSDGSVCVSGSSVSC